MLSKITSKFRGDFVWFVLTPNSSNGNRERNLLLCCLFSMRRNCVLSGFIFGLFTNIYDYKEAKHKCKLLNAAEELLDIKDTQLTIISKEK